MKLWRGNISPWQTQAGVTLYEHEGKILAVQNDETGTQIRDKVFLMRYGEQIGVVDHGRFMVSNRAWRYLDMNTTHHYAITDEKELDRYLRGEPIVSAGTDEYILITSAEQVL